MKKKIGILLTIFILMFTTKNVNADTWPNDYSHNEYEYSIEKVSLYIYEFDSTSEIITLTNGNTATKDGQNYMNEVTTAIKDLEASDFTINPVVSEKEINGTPALVINLNLNLTKEKLEEILATEMDTVTNNPNKSYMIDLVLTYKLTSFPDNFLRAYKVNTVRTLLNYFAVNKNTKQISIAENNTQVLNNIMIERDSITGEAYLDYETAATEENDNIAYVLNYQILTEEDYPIFGEPLSANSLFLMFHNITNIDDILNQVNSTTPTTPKDNPVTNNSSQTVNVPSTAWNISKGITIIGIVFMMMGCVVMSKNLLKEE